jgi:uncharacterized protein YydD (DUF2326 family)
MKLNGSISNQIFDELMTTVEVIGIDRTIKTLQEAKANSLILEDLNIEFILSCVKQVTGVSKDRILNGNDRNDERKIAIALCVYFIRKEFFYSYGDMSKIFNKDESSLSRYNSIVENKTDKPKTEFDKNIESYYKKINLLITEKKLKNG